MLLPYITVAHIAHRSNTVTDIGYSVDGAGLTIVPIAPWHGAPAVGWWGCKLIEFFRTNDGMVRGSISRQLGGCFGC